MKHPQAQSESLTTRWVDGELLITDAATHTAHCLTDEAARVFMRCTGQQSPEQIAAAESLTVERVAEILEKLGHAGLLQTEPSRLDLTRRAFASRSVQVTAVAAGAAPLVTSLLLPASAAAHASSRCTQAQHACSAHGTGSTANQALAHARSTANTFCRTQSGCGPTAVCASNFEATSYVGPNDYHASVGGHCSS